ncbi:VOC family protein [Nostoc sp. CMAA1605]|nr:VOC family protein [Nostoc sp. CMAA1605]
MKISGIHHIAIICSDYERSKNFYVDVLGFEIIHETFRAERNSYKLDLRINENTQIELFSFPSPPQRVSNPEACGLRHLAFAVENIEEAVAYLKSHGLEVENIRVDEITGRKFTFFQDPDKLPLEIYLTCCEDPKWNEVELGDERHLIARHPLNDFLQSKNSERDS